MNQLIDNFIQSFEEKFPVESRIVTQLKSAGGRVLVVGGVVRDLFLGLPAKDLDFEIYGLSLKQVELVLARFGTVLQVGRVFGVLRVDGVDADWSLPRIDGTGRHPHVTVDAALDYQTAFRRRDLTINAMGIDLRTGELIDPYSGKTDLQQKKLRYVDSSRFIDDPLRFYRVMQFIGRFEMTPDQELDRLCHTMDLTLVSKERIEQEFTKLFLKSRRPSLGLSWLQSIGRLQEILPELFAAIGVPQNPALHPEGDVFVHSLQALDVAANNKDYFDDAEKLLVMWAALCHDLGKTVTTQFIDGRWRSLGHAQAGVPLAKSLLIRVTDQKKLIAAVTKLVRYHMEPLQFVSGQAGLCAYKKLAAKLYPQTLCLLAKLSLADKMGRQIEGPILDQISFAQQPELEEFIAQAKLAGVWQKMEPPVLQGKDLLSEISAGPEIGELLQMAYAIQIQEGIRDREFLKQRVLKSRITFKKD